MSNYLEPVLAEYIGTDKNMQGLPAFMVPLSHDKCLAQFIMLDDHPYCNDHNEPLRADVWYEFNRDEFLAHDENAEFSRGFWWNVAMALTAAITLYAMLKIFTA
jgi:hypothetical protein